MRQPWFYAIFFVGSIAVMNYTHICKHFHFKNNKANTKNPIKINYHISGINIITASVAQHAIVP